VNIASSSNFEMTPLMSADSSGRAATVRALEDLQADVNQTNGLSALTFASWNRHADVVRLLVELKADVNPTDKDGVSAGRTCVCNSWSRRCC
jgi:ankyrin repeat protein